jgi:hypothetical protein
MNTEACEEHLEHLLDADVRAFRIVRISRVGAAL